MGQAIGGSLPLAVGIALSPIPIIAVVLAAGSTAAIICFNSCHGNRSAASPARY